ncbi:MAG: hypothetical protein SGPRY_008309, partial [Prymnesium sp.]
MSWSEHTSEGGRKFYYNRLSGCSQWDKPADLGSASPPPLSLHSCATSEPAVVNLLNAIIRHCGVGAIPVVSTVSEGDSFCEGGRGGAF